MLCKYCGAQLPDGTEKCEFCGAELIEEQTQEPAEETVVEETEAQEEVLDENELKRRAQMEKMLAEKQQQLSEIERRRNIKKKRQKQTKLIIICAVCVACIAVVGLGSYAIKESFNKPQTTPSPSPIVVTASPSATASAIPTPLTTTPAPLSSAAPAASSAPKAELNSSNTSSTSEVKSANASGSGSSASGTASSGSGASANASSSAQSGGSATAVSVAKPSGISTAKVEAQLTTGGEVLKNSDTGKYLMTFASGNTLYYANVSEGSTTEQIKNKNITITAHPTEERYKGNTIYEITSMTYYDDKDYIIPTSGTKLLAKNDVQNMSKQQLALARNEIYARHGRQFRMAEFRDYFAKKSWYKENPNYNYDNEGSNLNEIEAKNVVLLLSVENSK